MVRPILIEELFELNNKLSPRFDGDIIVIDDIFKNYNDIFEICNNAVVEQWKTDNSDKARNFKDYYDCRLKLINNFPDYSKVALRLNTLIKILSHYFKENPNNILAEKKLEFNYFKHIKKDVPINMQHFPHFDEYYNVIFYIDKFENGGTALYEYADIVNREEQNLMYDVSKLKIKKLIKSKPNRCVIFNGSNLHGAYIESHNIYRDNWRINMANFLQSNAQEAWLPE